MRERKKVQVLLWVLGDKERELLSDYRSELEEVAGRLEKIKEYL